MSSITNQITYKELLERLVVLETKLDLMSSVNGTTNKKFTLLAGLIIVLQVVDGIVNYYIFKGGR